MSDYYDPHPRIRLEKPIVLAGQIGCAAPAVGRNIAAQTGISFTEIDRLIEHEAGRSLARIAVEDSIDRLAAWADSTLFRIAGETPFGLIILDRAWPSMATRDTLRRRTHFVYLQRSIDFLRQAFAEELQRTGDWILRGRPGSAGDEIGLPELHARREPILCDAEIVLEAGDLHAHRIASMLLESLEQIVDVETA